MEVDYKDILDAVHIKNGDVVDLVADLGSVVMQAKKSGLTFDPNHFIDSLCERVGRNGTVLVRAFNWDFCKGKGFDYRTSRSQCGAYANLLMKRSDFRRTRHPLYSWYVWGNLQEYFCDLENTDAFGEDSIFAWEEMHESYFLRLGETKFSGFTIYYHLLQKLNLPFRYLKSWTGEYTDENGVTENRTYSMFVRHLEDEEGTGSFGDPYRGDFLENNLISVTESQGITVIKDDIVPECRIMLDDLRNNFPGKAFKGKWYGSFTLDMADSLRGYLGKKYPQYLDINANFLVRDGIIDETMIPEIASECELYYGVKIPEMYRTAEHFNSINAITAQVGLLLDMEK